jgi:hypothetical protein
VLLTTTLLLLCYHFATLLLVGPVQTVETVEMVEMVETDGRWL